MSRSDPQNVILNELDIRAEPFAICALEGACSMGLGRVPRATLHYVLGGEGQLSLVGQTPIDLRPGQVVLVPACMRHSLRNLGGGQTGLPACKPAGLDLEEHIARGEGSGTMVVLCSSVTLDMRGTHGLIDLLRAPLSLDLGQEPAARQAMQALVAEVTRARPGREAMIRVLLLQCVLAMLRARLEARDPAVMWMHGLVDPGLWRALQHMLDAPGAAHGLDTLASEAGMSRSRFAERFQMTYGRSPMHFLRELRLARAAQLLTEGREPVKRIATKVGFSSRSAFSRAFTEAWGVPPRAFRAGQ